jgi:prepilin peptidase CpaA
VSEKQVLLVVCVGIFTLVAAISDYRTRRIPNKLTVPMFVAGWIYQAWFSGWSGLGDAALGFAIGFGTLFVLWMIGGGGGGDVKLMGALSVWFGFQMTLLVLIGSTLFVLAGTLCVMAWSLIVKGPYRTKNKYVFNSSPGEKGKKPPKETIQERQQRRIMAYAIPVALAAWLIMFWKLPTI